MSWQLYVPSLCESRRLNALIGRNEKLISTHAISTLTTDDLLRPEPKFDEVDRCGGGSALLGIVMAAISIIVIYTSTPIDSPEWPDCPIQSLGSCGEK